MGRVLLGSDHVDLQTKLPPLDGVGDIKGSNCLRWRGQRVRSSNFSCRCRQGICRGVTSRLNLAACEMAIGSC